MKTYKYSQFNLIVQQTPKYVILYNTYSSKQRIFKREDFEIINDKTDITEELVEQAWIDGNFIITSDTDEIQRIKDRTASYYKNKDYMHLTIFTTLACNHRCAYCFEREHLGHGNMDINTQNSIIGFVIKQYKIHKYNNKLKITWFGGEPLLNLNAIRHISSELKNNNIDFIAGMFTNGRFLTKDVALELKELNVTDSVIISVDGLASTYSKIRGCKENELYTVLQNIKDCEDILNITIKINVSNATIQDADELYRIIRETYDIRSKIIHVGVEALNSDITTSENNIDYNKLRKIKQRDAAENKFIGIIDCPTRNHNYYVIGVNGELYLCSHLIGKKEFIYGYIQDIEEPLSRLGTIWDINDRIDKCKDCIALPRCLGGCATVKYLDKIDYCDKDSIISNMKQQALFELSNKYNKTNH